MGSHPAIEPHSLQGHVEGVVAEHPAFGAEAPEHVAFIAVDGLEGLEVIAGLPRERDQVVFPCLLYTSPSPRDVEESRMPSSA